MKVLLHIVIAVFTISFFGIQLDLKAQGIDIGVCPDNRSQSGQQVTICHVPPGALENAYTVTVGVASLDPHIGQNGDGLHGGDYCGACQVSELDPCDKPENLEICVKKGIYY